jgi:RNA polymerase sigma-70 factor, ECF subfamily
MTSVPIEAGGSTSLSLIARARDRDADAWRRLTLLYGPLVYSWCRQAGLQEADAADVVQDVFRAVATGIDGFRSGPDTSFRGWLWGIVRNKLSDHFRRRASQATSPGGTDAYERLQQIPEIPFDELGDSDPSTPERKLVHRALAVIRGDFDERTWQAFWRLAVGGESAAEIGDALDMTPRAVRQAKYRVLQRLRSELEGEVG